MPKTAQDTIPFIQAYDNGLFLVDDNKYTLIFAFENIDYLLIRDTEQMEIYNKYMKLLNSLPSDVNYQEFIMNTDIDIRTLEKSLIPQENKRFTQELYEDYCNVMRSFVNETKDSTAKKITLVAMSYCPESQIDNVNILFRYYREMQSYFTNMKSDTHQLHPMEVFSVLYKIYHQFDNDEFLLPKNFLSRGHRIKDYIAPSMFAFKGDLVEIGTSFTRVMALKGFDRTMDDTFIADLLDNNEKIIVSKHIRRIDKSVALDNVHTNIVDLQAKVQKRMENNHKRGMNYIPLDYEERLNEMNNLYEQLSDTNCELFNVSIFISVSAKTKEELDILTQYIQSRATKHQVKIGILGRQQEEGLNSILPFANNKFTKTKNAICTNILSDAASVLLPFTSINHFTGNGVCYGISINSSTKSIITLDRTDEMNSNGFVLGTSGSGKSMFTKMEIIDVFMKNPDDEIIVIDPENEYAPLVQKYDGEILKLSPNSKTYFNVFETDLSYSEDGANAIAMKSSFIMSVIETAKGLPLTSNEKSIIDRCVRILYKDFIESNGDKTKLPTLKDFYALVRQQEEQEAKDIATSIELYATGSFDIFAHQTNVNINKQFLVIDIFDMGEQLRSVGMQVILEYLWQRVIENKKNGKRTWIWIDEFSYFFNDSNETSRSGDFFAKAYKRIRKHGGTVTGITQNITEVLESKQAQHMLGNAEFVVLLQQKKEDLIAITRLFDLSDTQISYIKSGEVGTGLIICGQKIIPFEKKISNKSLMYKICQTTMQKAKSI